MSKQAHDSGVKKRSGQRSDVARAAAARRRSRKARRSELIHARQAEVDTAALNAEEAAIRIRAKAAQAA
jgi:hypothetical protein